MQLTSGEFRSLAARCREAAADRDAEGELFKRNVYLTIGQLADVQAGVLDRYEQAVRGREIAGPLLGSGDAAPPDSGPEASQARPDRTKG